MKIKSLLLTIGFLVFTVSIILAQEPEEVKIVNKKQEKSRIILDDISSQQAIEMPDIYLNGKKFDFPLDLIDQNIIESVTHIRGEQAIKDYNAPNGVVLVETRKNNDPTNINIIVKGSGNFSGKAPMIIIDGEKTFDREKLVGLSPEDVEDITIIKGASASALYGKEAANGVIIVKTKKEKKK